MTELDQRRVAEWIRDAFAILCVRASGRSDAERKLRLGFEALLRHLGTSPLHEVTRSSLPFPGGMHASTSDLRTIIKALDSCVVILQRYDSVLTTGQRRMQILVRATRRFAEEELGARTPRATAAATNARPNGQLVASSLLSVVF
jgi:hypothetical protein